MTLAGIDVSAIGQGDSFGWGAYRGKIAFAGIKISEGTTFADPAAQHNIRGARDIGAVPMGYHFLRASASGLAQANWFMDRCKAAGLERGDLMSVDVEQGGMDGLTPADLWETTVTFAHAIQAHFGAWPVVYTDISLAGPAPATIGPCPLWLANPSRIPTRGGAGPWKVVSFEQTGQSGVDQDVFYGDAQQLAALAIPAAVPAPPAPVKPAAPAPTGLKQAEVQADVRLSWNRVPGQTSYRLQTEWYKQGFGWVLQVNTVVTQAYVAKSLAAGKYRWRVAAGAAEHKWSEWQVFEV